jgi:hypothetical protein
MIYTFFSQFILNDIHLIFKRFFAKILIFILKIFQILK